MAADVVLGIDLSLTGLGLVAVPTDWDMRWDRVRFLSLGIELTREATARDYALRRRQLADDVATWASRRGVTKAYVEGYPMGGRLYNIDKICELGGVLKDRLIALDLYPVAVAESTGRKLLLGALPQHARKAVVFEALQQCGAPFTDADQSDAFVAANAGLAELGATFVTFGMTNQPRKARKRTRAA